MPSSVMPRGGEAGAGDGGGLNGGLGGGGRGCRFGGNGGGRDGGGMGISQTYPMVKPHSLSSHEPSAIMCKQCSVPS